MADYFETAELRSLPDLDDSARFPDARLDAARAWVVSLIERECDTSFVETEVTETLDGGCGLLVLASAYVRSVTSVEVEGVAVDPDAYKVRHGLLTQRSGAPWGYGDVTVTYVAGYSATPPPDLKEAAMRAARNWLLTGDAWSSSIDSRATSMTNDYGNINLSTPGDGRPTGLPDVDSTIMAWARRVRVPKVS